MKKLPLLMFLMIIISCSKGNIEEDMALEKAFKPKENKKITICHKENETISISINALQAHLDHGDKIGPCGYTYIPDDNFEAALSYLDDIEGDNLVPTANIEMETNLYVQNSNISDLTGIQDFTNLEHLECWKNQLSSLDLSQNKLLQYVDCRTNLLTNLDMSQNSDLMYLYCQSNQLTEIDVSQNTKLDYFYCFNNQLTELDISQNVSLRFFYSYTNQLKNLNLTQNTKLVHLRCYDNQITTLDLSQNKDLLYLYCASNELMELDISQNEKLVSLYCMNNDLPCIQRGSNTLAALMNVNTGGVDIEVDCNY